MFGIDPDELTPTERANASLGVAESTMVRRLNTRLNNVLDGYGYRRFVREIVVHQHLARRQDSARLSLPPDVHAWAATLARSWVSELALRGYDVVGDLDDLIPGADPRPFVDPDTVDEHEVAEVGARRLAVMTIEAARLRQVEKELHGVIEDLMGQLDDGPRHPHLPVQGAARRPRPPQRGSRVRCTPSTGGCAAGTPEST